MNEENGLWVPERDHRIEEGGWQKPVAPPKADARPPAGLPPKPKKPALPPTAQEGEA